MAREDLHRVKTYALHFAQPITNIKAFNELLIENGIKPVRKKTVVKLLGY